MFSAINNTRYQNQSESFLVRRISNFAENICLIINDDSLFDMKISVFRIFVKLGCITVPKYCCFIAVILLILRTICQQVTRISILLLYCCTRKRNYTAFTLDQLSESFTNWLDVFFAWINQGSSSRYRKRQVCLPSLDQLNRQVLQALVGVRQDFLLPLLLNQN